MKRIIAAVLAAVMATPAIAHDAFGNIGPFYASLLHPLADAVQATVILATSAFLAARGVDAVRVALPSFMVSAAICTLASSMIAANSPDARLLTLLSGVTAVLAGIGAMLPDRMVPRLAGIGLVVGAGALAGLSPGSPASVGMSFLQVFLGTVLGTSIMVTLLWAALDFAARRISHVAPAVAGSWVAAMGVLVLAFELARP